MGFCMIWGIWVSEWPALVILKTTWVITGCTPHNSRLSDQYDLIAYWASRAECIWHYEDPQKKIAIAVMAIMEMMIMVPQMFSRRVGLYSSIQVPM